MMGGVDVDIDLGLRRYKISSVMSELQSSPQRIHSLTCNLPPSPHGESCL